MVAFMKMEVLTGGGRRQNRAGSRLCQGLRFLLLCLFLGGCSGGDEAATAPENIAETTKEGNPLTAPVDYLGAVNQAQKSSARKLNLMGIQQAIQQFQVMEDRLPQTLREVVSSGYISRLPEMPKGQSLHYDPRTGVVSQVQTQESAAE